MFADETAMRAKITAVIEANDGTVFFLGDAIQTGRDLPGETGTLILRQYLFEMHGSVAVLKRFDFFKTLGGQCWFKDRNYRASRSVLVNDYELDPAPPVEEIQE
jgi:hypothetical protein